MSSSAHEMTPRADEPGGREAGQGAHSRDSIVGIALWAPEVARYRAPAPELREVKES